MPILDGPDDEEVGTSPSERVAEAARRVAGVVSSDTYPLRSVLWTAGILLSLSSAPAPWLQIGLLCVFGLLIESTRRGRIRA